MLYSFSCSLSLLPLPPSHLPPPPSPVLNVALSELTFSDGNIEFVFHWKPPVTTNGHVKHYEACLGGRELSQFEVHDPGSLASTDENDTHCIDIFDVSVLIVRMGMVLSVTWDSEYIHFTVITLPHMKFHTTLLFPSYSFLKPFTPGITEPLVHSVSTSK